MKILETVEGFCIYLKVIPNASKNEICGVYNNDLIKVKIAKAPESGKANKECEKVFAKFLGLRKKDVSIVSGHTSTLKTLQIQGLTESQIKMILSKI